MPAKTKMLHATIFLLNQAQGPVYHTVYHQLEDVQYGCRKADLSGRHRRLKNYQCHIPQYNFGDLRTKLGREKRQHAWAITGVCVDDKCSISTLLRESYGMEEALSVSCSLKGPCILSKTSSRRVDLQWNLAGSRPPRSTQYAALDAFLVNYVPTPLFFVIRMLIMIISTWTTAHSQIGCYSFSPVKETETWNVTCTV